MNFTEKSLNSVLTLQHLNNYFILSNIYFIFISNTTINNIIIVLSIYIYIKKEGKKIVTTKSSLLPRVEVVDHLTFQDTLYTRPFNDVSF